MGEGSGVIIDELGHVITSWHVIEGARDGAVVLNDGTKMAAELVGFDKATDLAILKIKDRRLEFPAIEFGDSDSVRVGESGHCHRFSVQSAEFGNGWAREPEGPKGSYPAL